MNKNFGSQSGFSLIELMIAMSLSLLLILGIATVFSSLKNTSSYSQQLENTQEVLRFTNSTFSRAVHRADEMSGGSTLTLTFNLDNLDTDEKFIDCRGEEKGLNEKYTETYSLENNELICTTKIDSTSVEVFSAIGSNIEALSFLIDGELLTVTITPSIITNTVSSTNDEIKMMFALRQKILGLSN